MGVVGNVFCTYGLGLHFLFYLKTIFEWALDRVSQRAKNTNEKISLVIRMNLVYPACKPGMDYKPQEHYSVKALWLCLHLPVPYLFVHLEKWLFRNYDLNYDLKYVEMKLKLQDGFDEKCEKCLIWLIFVWAFFFFFFTKENKRIVHTTRSGLTSHCPPLSHWPVVTFRVKPLIATWRMRQ